MSNRKPHPLPPMGGTVIASFALLCLVATSMLVLTGVQSNSRRHEASDKAVNSYYQADLEAEKIYARLQAGESIEGVREEKGIYSYACPISETSTLEVQVQKQDGKWTVLRWEQVDTQSAPTED